MDPSPQATPGALAGEPEFMLCPRCRYRDRRRMRFCAHCGCELGEHFDQQSKAPWRLLRADMTADDVREVLGAPLFVEVNDALGQVHWFYSEFKMSGPRVQFGRDSGCVTFWREP